MQSQSRLEWDFFGWPQQIISSQSTSIRDEFQYFFDLLRSLVSVWSEWELTCFCYTTRRTFTYILFTNTFLLESPWLWDVNRVNTSGELLCFIGYILYYICWLKLIVQGAKIVQNSAKVKEYSKAKVYNSITKEQHHVYSGKPFHVKTVKNSNKSLSQTSPQKREGDIEKLINLIEVRFDFRRSLGSACLPEGWEGWARIHFPNSGW